MFTNVAGVACTIDNNCTEGCTVVDDVEICYCLSGYQLDTDDISCLGMCFMYKTFTDLIQ